MSHPNDMSARPCGCDPGCNHRCEWHDFDIQVAAIYAINEMIERLHRIGDYRDLYRNPHQED